jgi:hypothetical protein
MCCLKHGIFYRVTTFLAFFILPVDSSRIPRVPFVDFSIGLNSSAADAVHVSPDDDRCDDVICNAVDSSC